MTHLDADSGKPHLNHAAKKPLGKGGRLKTNSNKVIQWVSKCPDKLIRMTEYLNSRIITLVSSTMHTDVSFSETSKPAKYFMLRFLSDIQSC
jgi:hypothetical protein